jgi:hypothetical protein
MTLPINIVQMNYAEISFPCYNWMEAYTASQAIQHIKKFSKVYYHDSYWILFSQFTSLEPICILSFHFCLVSKVVSPLRSLNQNSVRISRFHHVSSYTETLFKLKGMLLFDSSKKCTNFFWMLQYVCISWYTSKFLFKADMYHSGPNIGLSVKTSWAWAVNSSKTTIWNKNRIFSYF